MKKLIWLSGELLRRECFCLYLSFIMPLSVAGIMIVWLPLDFNLLIVLNTAVFFVATEIYFTFFYRE